MLALNRKIINLFPFLESTAANSSTAMKGRSMNGQ